jgi:hypothetical protein
MVPAASVPDAAGGASSSSKSARCGAAIALTAFRRKAFSHLWRITVVPARSSDTGRVSANGSNRRAQASS